MPALSHIYEFDWDFGNSEKNFKTHRVSRDESEEAFFNIPVVVFTDTGHSISELRGMLWGITDNGRKLTIISTLRENKIRVISARDMSRKERSYYEKKAGRNTKI